MIIKDTIVAQEIPRIFETLCQEPGTKASCILYIMTLTKYSEHSCWARYYAGHWGIICIFNRFH